MIKVGPDILPISDNACRIIRPDIRQEKPDMARPTLSVILMPNAALYHVQLVFDRVTMTGHNLLLHWEGWVG